MAKYIRPEVLEVFSFDDLIEYGIDHGGNIVDGIPWSFELDGYPVTNEDECSYIITGTPSGDVWFHRGEYLIFGNGRVPFVVENIPEELKPVDEKADLSRYFANLNFENAALRAEVTRLTAERDRMRKLAERAYEFYSPLDWDDPDDLEEADEILYALTQIYDPDPDESEANND